MRSVFIAVLFFASLPAQAADFSDPIPRYERAGGGFACRMSKQDFTQAETEKRDVCLHIGPLFVGMLRTDAETLLGKPVTSVPVGTREAFAYQLQSVSTGRMNTYVVFTYDNDGHADSVQLTGAPWPSAWQFAGLTLGVAQTAVTERLGAPMQTQKSDDPGATQWSYSPWTFSFEVKDGVVSSIRIAAE
jgi:hypothetical protein